MNYEEFIGEIKKYWDLRQQGLKKQANCFLFEFTDGFKKNVSEENADEILFQFCREYIDELKFPGDALPRRHLPFQITEILNGYLRRECEKQKMPQMRWMYQIFGNYYNPHDKEHTNDPYHILELAYTHEECDQETVNLYFNEQVESLWWGQHHFPEGCLITKEDFNNIVQRANRILSEKSVDASLVESFRYYEKLYKIYFDWVENGREPDFYEICEAEGIEFEGWATYYYNMKRI